MDPVAIDFGCDGTLQEVDRDDEPAVFADGKNKTFEAEQRSGVYADSLSDLEEWPRLDGKGGIDHRPNRIDLRLGDRGRHSAETHN